MRFRQEEGDDFVSCAWWWGNTAVRVAVAGLGVLFPFPVIIFGLWRKNHLIMWLVRAPALSTGPLLTVPKSTALCFLMALFVIAPIMLDCKSVLQSRGWCVNTLDADRCAYWPFFGLILYEMIVFGIWVRSLPPSPSMLLTDTPRSSKGLCCSTIACVTARRTSPTLHSTTRRRTATCQPNCELSESYTMEKDMLQIHCYCSGLSLGRGSLCVVMSIPSLMSTREGSASPVANVGAKDR